MSLNGDGYAFDERKEAGDEGEAILDYYLSQRFELTKPPEDAEMRWKFDRILRSGQKRYTVEYKNCEWADRTGNLFIETVSNSETGSPGWALNTIAQIICYRLNESGRVFFLDSVQIRICLDDIQGRFETKSVQNEGYCTEGVLVPIPYAQNRGIIIAEVVFQ